MSKYLVIILKALLTDFLIRSPCLTTNYRILPWKKSFQASLYVRKYSNLSSDKVENMLSENLESNQGLNHLGLRTPNKISWAEIGRRLAAKNIGAELTAHILSLCVRSPWSKSNVRCEVLLHYIHIHSYLLDKFFNANRYLGARILYVEERLR